MKWVEVADYDSMSRAGAEGISQALIPRLKAGDRFNLGLATGNTMLGLYRQLAENLNREHVDLGRLHTYNLDEYVGEGGKAVPAGHPLSYRRYMDEQFFQRLDPGLGLVPDHVHFPDPEHAGLFDQEMADGGGLDLQLLGLGFNGHIAFNEPMSADEITPADFAGLPSRCVDLKPLTIQTNSRLTAGNDASLVPHHAVTMGMRQILAARKCLLLACFPEQLDPLRRLLEIGPTPEFPASFLVEHPATTIIYTVDTIPLEVP